MRLAKGSAQRRILKCTRPSVPSLSLLLFLRCQPSFLVHLLVGARIGEGPLITHCGRTPRARNATVTTNALTPEVCGGGHKIEPKFRARLYQSR